MLTIIVSVTLTPTVQNQSNEKSESPLFDPIKLSGKSCSSKFAPAIKIRKPVLKN
jgi:hypothetical protein